ncbi:effector-associated constant component EACC1 [Streptomyces sp. NBC_00448]|uniref:effector-associated constant component EACC1 n=1 Tax=Streptomyces sp. NBC_00448 TaxID=2903652 RepID=UPI002E1CE88C
MVEIDVRTAGDPGDSAEDDLRSLLRWVRADENLAGRADGRVRDGTPPQPGRMGGAFDILQLSIGSGLSAGALLVSLLQWRDARHRPPAITLRRGRMTVEIPATPEVDAATLARAVELLTAERPDGAEARGPVPADQMAIAAAAPPPPPMPSTPPRIPAPPAPSPPPSPPPPPFPSPPSAAPVPAPAPAPASSLAAHTPAPRPDENIPARLTEEPEGDGTPS